MDITFLALKSFRNRRVTMLLTAATIAVSVILLLGVYRLQQSVEKGFTNAISGTDLVVGSSTGEEQLILSTVFELGELNGSVSWEVFNHFKNDERVKWAYPITIGDSYNGFNVVGTTKDLFSFYKYGDKKPLIFADGVCFNRMFEIVIGADVANEGEYNIGDELILQHGSDAIGAHHHDEKPFVVSGILKRTGTVLDKRLFVSLEALEGVHINYVDGLPDEELSFTADELLELNLKPKKISAFFIGLKSRSDLLFLQKEVNNYKPHALTAASPAFVLINLWKIMDKVESVLFVISGLVLFSGMTSVLIALLTSIKERRREIAILRSLGASSRHIYTLIIGESAVVTFVGLVFGYLVLIILTFLLSPIFEESYGLALNINFFDTKEIISLCLIMVIGVLIGIIPAFIMHRLSLKDGMTIKI